MEYDQAHALGLDLNGEFGNLVRSCAFRGHSESHDFSPLHRSLRSRGRLRQPRDTSTSPRRSCSGPMKMPRMRSMRSFFKILSTKKWPTNASLRAFPCPNGPPSSRRRRRAEHGCESSQLRPCRENSTSPARLIRRSASRLARTTRMRRRRSSSRMSSSTHIQHRRGIPLLLLHYLRLHRRRRWRSSRASPIITRATKRRRGRRAARRRLGEVP